MTAGETVLLLEDLVIRMVNEAECVCGLFNVVQHVATLGVHHGVYYFLLLALHKDLRLSSASFLTVETE